MAQISSAATAGSTGANPGLLPSRAALKRTVAVLALLSGRRYKMHRSAY